ncbi:SDR family NAD(P)-dependent oxidoreductase [Patulibacter minatonensis]|uniref:SDR family NAD(P)-dependent oxidoreductase n=1 Tax=Patulibacter minatonensis TaxID=298163 RepID=UPI00047BD116|nr:SDR family NAD(P)-dependent oxidoreductase [Patulibacter minatonensis]
MTGVVVVTGASSGIGRDSARLLAEAGYRVLGTVRRDPDARELEAQHPGITAVRLDVTDADSIEQARATIDAACGPAGLAGLVNNAGDGLAMPLEFLEAEPLRRHYEVNVVGPLAVTRALLPALRRARGRIVFIGSIGGHVVLPFAGPLVSSKHALTALATALRLELRPWGLPVAIVEPTTIASAAVGKLEEQTARSVDAFDDHGRELYGERFPAAIRTAVAHERRGAEPVVVARVVLRAMTDRRPRTRYPAGPGARGAEVLWRLAPDRLLDALMGRVFGLRRGSAVRDAG